MKTNAFYSLSDLYQSSKWKIWSAKRLGISVEEVEQRIEEKKQEYKQQQEAKAIEHAKKRIESSRRKNYKNAVSNGKFVGTFDEYCQRLDRLHSMTPEEKAELDKISKRQRGRERNYAIAVQKGKFDGTFDEYCQHLDRVYNRTPEEKANAHKIYNRERNYALAVQKGKFDGTFDEYCQHLDRDRHPRGKARTLQEKVEAHRIAAKISGRKRSYINAVQKGKFDGTFDEYCQHLDRVYNRTPEEKKNRQYQKLVQAGCEIGTFEDFTRILDEANRLKKMMREIDKTKTV